MSAFKDFPGLENLEKKFKDFQGPARALEVSYMLQFSRGVISIYGMQA